MRALEVRVRVVRRSGEGGGEGRSRRQGVSGWSVAWETGASFGVVGIGGPASILLSEMSERIGVLAPSTLGWKENMKAQQVQYSTSRPKLSY